MLSQNFWYVKRFTNFFSNFYAMKTINFAENLRSLRTSKNLTQKQLAEMLCVDQRTVSAWEKKVCEPSFALLLKLCEIFDESFDNLLT